MSTKSTSREAKSVTKIHDSTKLEAIIEEISKLEQDDLAKHHAWDDLDALSSQTEFEGIEPHPDGIFKTNSDHFEAIATAYVTLNYGGKKDGTSMSDSYPAKIVGSVDKNNRVKIESISVDTSSFYQ